MNVMNGEEEDITSVEQMDVLRKHPAYGLDNGDWASVCAEKIMQVVGRYLDDEPLDVPDLPVAGPGLLDGMEEYVRACREVSPAVSLELMLPAGYAYAGSLGGGGVWVAWNGRGTWQVSPCSIQAIGLAPSGVGKSTQQKLLNVAYGPAAELHVGAVQREVSDWAATCPAMIDMALAKDLDALTAMMGGDEELAELKRGVKYVKKIVAGIDLDVSVGVKLEYSDATAEALVSGAIAYGGGAFIRSAEQDVLDNLTRYSASGGSASMTLYTDGWDGAAYSRDRKGSGFEHTSALVLSMSLMTQNESFAKAFMAAGDGWLSKGMLGRAWLTKGAEVDLDDMLASDESRRKAGVVPVTVPESLVGGLEVLALAGAQARAARMLEDRVTRAVRSAAGEASMYVKKALAACRGAAGAAVSLESVAVNSGYAGGMKGLVLRLGAPEAQRMEDLHAWGLRCFSVVGKEDPVLAPLITRLTYHIAKLAGMRALMLDGVDPEVGEVPAAVLADTATRLVPWLVGMHMRALGGLVRGLNMEQVRTGMVAAHGRDTSMGGMIVEALRTVPGLKFPMSVTEVVNAVARGEGARGHRQGIKEYFAQQYVVQVVEKREGDGYFTIGAGRKKGSVVVNGFGSGTKVSVTPAGMMGIKGMTAAG